VVWHARPDSPIGVRPRGAGQRILGSFATRTRFARAVELLASGQIGPWSRAASSRSRRARRRSKRWLRDVRPRA
jgi:hypothetical protein